MSTTRKAILIVVGVVIFLAVIVLLAYATTDAGEAATPKINRAAPQFQAGQLPMTFADASIQNLSDIELDKKGCTNAHAAGYINSLGLRAVNTDMWQYFCWAHGHITRVDPVKRKVDLTAWGEAINWNFDGWRDGPDGWTNYGNKYHGGHYATKTAKFHGCVQFALPGVGCITIKNVALRHSLLEHAGGRWWANVTT